ncbi:MAG: adenosylcobinamide-GDP ribazoletransferase [Myxococcales bacterium]
MPDARLAGVLRPLFCAVGFLTRLPVPHTELEERDVARSAAYFAWVGLALGAALWGLSRLFGSLGGPLGSLLLVAAWAWLTGGLHLDGLADTVDGLSGGRGDRARTLEIMRDSRIGSHGAVALVLGLGIKAAALVRARELGLDAVWCAPAVARFGCTLLLASFPYARAQGLGSAFAGRVGALEVGVGALALGLPVVLLGPASTGYALGACAGLGCALLLAFRVRQRLGGLTGDVHGAAIEVCEIGMLIGLCAFPLR